MMHIIRSKTKPHMTINKDPATNIQGKVKTLINHNCGIKCFGDWHIALQCPNKIVMIMRENEESEFKSEKFQYLVDRELLMIRR
jgi:hypothetical protein